MRASLQFKDHFSNQAADYARFRPRYPGEIFEYLGSIAPARRLAWDCATGNGQAAVGLANVFDRVIATDASKNQISNAAKHERIEYRVTPAEESGLPPNSFDLVMVAQALQWLNQDRFYPEVRRILKANGGFAASAYNHLRTDEPIKEIIKDYYDQIVGPYWPPERALIEQFEKYPSPFRSSKDQTSKSLQNGTWNIWRVICDHGPPPKDSLRRRTATRSIRSATIFALPGGDPEKARRIAWPVTLRVGICSEL